MFSAGEFEKLGRLLNNLHICMDIKFGLLDVNAREVYTAAYRTPFCRLIAQAEGGYARCVNCDAEALRHAGQAEGPVCYRCHAGLVEVALAVRVSGEQVGYILFGQMLDDSPLERQWQDTRRRCAWYGDMDELYRAFCLLKVMSRQQISALGEIVDACVSEARLSGMLISASRDEAGRLRDYIAAHYAEPITIPGICAALSLSKSKLYAICRADTGRTVSELICERRIDAARALLRGTDDSVRQISETVGYADFNYFTRVFRQHTGLTPSEYRRQVRAADDSAVDRRATDGAAGNGSATSADRASDAATKTRADAKA